MNLIKKSYSEILSHARYLGLKASKENIKPGTNLYSDIEEFAVGLYQNEQEIMPNDQNICDEKANLRRLLTLMVAWEYKSLFIEDRVRNHIKYKAELDKTDRRLVNTGMAIMTYYLCKRSNEYMEKIVLLSNTESNISLYDEDMFISALSKEDIINIAQEQIEKLNEFENKQYNSTSYIHENFNAISEAGKAIERFVVTNKKKKIAQVLSVLIGLISSLASASVLAMGVIAMIGGGPLGALLAVATFIFTFYANAKFLNKAMPDFILKLMREGSITNYVDEEGNRRHLSFFKRFVIVPLTILGSLSISVLTTIFTIKSLTFLFMHYAPAMITVPYLIPVLAIMAAVCLGISISVTSIAASVKMIKAYEQSKGLKEWFESFNNLSVAEKFKFGFKALVLPIAIFSLGFLEYLHAFRIIPVLGIAGAATVAIFSFIGRISFISYGVDKLRAAISNRFNTQGDSFLEKVFYYVSLSWQSLVSGALIWFQPHAGASVSAIGGTINAFGGIMNKEPKHSYMRVIMEDKMSERIGLRDYSAFTAKENKDTQDTPVNKYWWDSYSNEKISINREEVPMVSYSPSSSRLFLLPQDNSDSYADTPVFSKGANK